VSKDLRLYLRLLGYARPYWKVAAVSVLAMVTSAGLEPVFPALMQPLIDKSLIEKSGPSLWQVPLFIVIAFVFKGIADYVASVSSQYLAQRTIADLRSSIFKHLLDLPMKTHHAEESGRMLSRVTYDTSMVGEAVSSAWLTLIKDSLVVIGLMGFMFYTAWQLTILVFLLAPFLAFAIRRINRQLRNTSRQVQTWMGRLNGVVEDALDALKEIKIFGAHKQQEDRFGQTNHSLRRENMRAVRIQALNVPLVQVLAATSVAIVVFVASQLSRSEMLTPGEFVSFITAMSMVFEPIRRLTNVNTTLQRGLAAAESIFGLLDLPGEGTHSGIIKNNGSKLPAFLEIQQLCFKDVSFRYPSAHGDALTSFNAVFPAGRLNVLRGPSGAGKSTIFNLLCRFQEPTAGAIYLNQFDISSFDINSWRPLISMVDQKITFLDLTIRENLTMGQPNVSDEQINEALKLAHAWQFIAQLPLGIDTVLSASSTDFSGGQRQRLALARAILKGSSIWLLDEPTSALDEQTSAKFWSTLQDLANGRVIIVATHETRFIEDCPVTEVSVNTRNHGQGQPSEK
jgi:subfamily B ATP-binding cassette protein MsbA